MIDAVCEAVNERLGSEAPRVRSAMVLGASQSESLKVVLLLFDVTGAAVAVAKVARGSAGEHALRAEHDVLAAVWATGASAVVRHAPRLLGLETIAGRSVLLTTALDGDPMLTSYFAPGHVAQRDAVRRDFDAASAWLIGFQQQTRGPAVAVSDAIGSWSRSLRASWREHVGQSEEDEAHFDEIDERAAAMGGTLPTVAVHGDFWMGNLLTERGTVSGVLDWEFGAARGLPFRDLYKFPTSYGSYLDRVWAGRANVPGHPERSDVVRRFDLADGWANEVGIVYTWFGTSWFPLLVARYVERVSAPLGLSHGVHAMAFPLFVAEQALALDDEEFRTGYRSVFRSIRAHAAEAWFAAPLALATVRDPNAD